VLIAKKGHLRIHHYAHKSNEVCDAWTDRNMTKWHQDWQMLAPEECREIRMEHDSEVQIADIRLLDVFMVVEVQHSPITLSEVLRREAFYHILP